MTDKNPSSPGKDTARQVPWGPRSAVTMTVAIYFAAQIAVGILLSIYAGVRHLNIDEVTSQTDNSALGQFVLVFLVETITLVLLFWFLKRRKATLADIAIRRTPKWKDALYALTGFAIYFPAYIVVVQVVQALVPNLNVNQKQELGFQSTTSGGMLWLVFIALVVLPPLTEELLIRGFLYSGLRRGYPKLKAMIITSVIFGIAHLQIGSGNALLWIAAIDTFVLSIVLVELRERTGNLWASMGLHMIKNGLAFLGLFIFHLS